MEKSVAAFYFEENRRLYSIKFRKKPIVKRKGVFLCGELRLH